MRKILSLFLVLSLGVVLTGCGENEQANVLVVGLECNYAPFNWTVSDSNEVAVEINGVNAYCDGYDIKIAQEIADELEYELVIRKIEWDGLIPALLADEIDVIIAGMSPTPERSQTVTFTDEYYRSEQVLVVQEGSSLASASSLDDFIGTAIVAQLGTLQDGLIDQINNVNHLTALTDYPSLVQAVSSGIADALVAELPVAESIIASNGDLTIVYLGNNGFTVSDNDVSVSVAVRHEDTELLELINSVLDSISSETRNSWMSEALTRQP
ncbi:Arginine-binding extracellular protein ArtP precursor [Candidatus Izimaplasma bacterium HR1]|jgi:ABC-type amino acid transport substrate-binding protein|uniref:transporter substrate-binding domain-containing protein n=1 Tax=Candidatus Izimoplasma sp. HR1 TaxID=1541959 RepID=UPI0004F72CE4|nr:Arginine-binding extracellular protein ArtP precursor [Candidatus Izimaplasma bacterium HR1]